MRLILTYHSLHARGWNYDSNDHIALWHDLLLLKHLRYCVVPLEDLVHALGQKNINRLPERTAAITFDDGVDHDFVDFFHNRFGYLSSFRTIIESSIAAGFPASATSFVIASPSARKQLDQTCIAGRGEWNDTWWLQAASLEYWAIGNHSWDHNHSCLDERVLAHANPDQFDSITSIEDADAQIMKAQEYISARTSGKAKRWFAYPFGHYNAFLAENYIPHIFNAEAAFVTGGTYITEDSDIFKIPRFVCGEHWNIPDELIQILEGRY